VAVVGGGLIGLSIAWRLAERGVVVTVIDDMPRMGASWAAAGMLAPVTEVHYGEEPLLELTLRAAREYPGFVEELEAATGQSVGYRPCGTLNVAFDSGDQAALDDLCRYQQALGLAVQPLSSRECREREPLLAPGIRGGAFVAGDHQVDNRRLGVALELAAGRAGAVLVHSRCDEVMVEHDRVTGVRLTGGGTVTAPCVVLAAGCWSAAVGGVEAMPVRPVKGQFLILRTPGGSPAPTHNLRGTVRGIPVYMVPREDGRIVVGATVEDRGFDTRTTVDATRTLLRDAQTLVPGLDEAELIEVGAGLRPGTPDNAPLLGRVGPEGLIAATGHYRNGVLLAPLTAAAIATLVVDGTTPELITPFSPQRFAVAPHLAVSA
jgi:glycine oxidase